MKKLTMIGTALILASVGIGTLSLTAEASSQFGPVDNGDGTATAEWLMPAGSTPDNVGWPQTAVNPDACGTGWIQVDKLRFATDAEKAGVRALWDDNVLNRGEDSPYYISATFVQQTPCVTAPITTGVPSSTPTSPAPTGSPTSVPTGSPTTPPVTVTPTPPVTPPVTSPSPTSTPSSPATTPAPTTPASTASTPARQPVLCSSATSSASPSRTPTTGSTSSSAPACSSSMQSSNGSLAYTGSPNPGPGLASALLLLLGGVALLVIRRRASR